MGSFWILNTIIHNFFFWFLMMLIQQSEKKTVQCFVLYCNGTRTLVWWNRWMGCDFMFVNFKNGLIMFMVLVCCLCHVLCFNHIGFRCVSIPVSHQPPRYSSPSQIFIFLAARWSLFQNSTIFSIEHFNNLKIFVWHWRNGRNPLLCCGWKHIWNSEIVYIF